MAKKAAKKRKPAGKKSKKAAKKRKPAKKHKKVQTTRIIESTDTKTLHILAENFLSLQRAMTNMAVKFDSLTDQISKLLNLFEISARDFVEREQKGKYESDKELAKKINSLMDQNRTMAQGLHIMGERIKAHPHIPTPPRQQYTQSINESSSTLQESETFPTPPMPPQSSAPNLPQEKEKPRTKPLPRY
ncbi:MAG: hypothetical protein ABIH72_02445 [archaeon]